MIKHRFLRDSPGSSSPPFIQTLSPIAWHDADFAASIYTSAAAGFPKRNACASLSSASSAFNTGAGVDFAWAGWIKWGGASDISLIAGKAAAGAYEWTCLLNYPTLGKVSFSAYPLTGDGGSGGTAATWGSTITAGDWTHVAVWRNAAGGTINISVNNAAPVSVATAQPATSGSAAFCMGLVSANNAYNFGGSIGPCGYWNRPLTQGASSDLSALYNGGTPLYYASLAAGQLSGLVAYYDFDTAAHLTADRTGGGHTLTNNNTVNLAAGPFESAIIAGALATRWNDRSGNGNHYLTPPGNAGPAYTELAQNGLPMLFANKMGSLACDSLAVAISGTNKQFSYFTVIKGMIVDGIGQQVFLAATRPLGINDPVEELSYDGPATGNWWAEGLNDAGNFISLYGSTPPNNGCHVLGYVANATTLTLHLDGVSIGATARQGGTTTLNIFTILAHRNHTDDQLEPFSGYIGEDVLLSYVPDGATLAAISSYFRDKWGSP